MQCLKTNVVQLLQYGVGPLQKGVSNRSNYCGLACDGKGEYQSEVQSLTRTALMTGSQIIRNMDQGLEEVERGVAPAGDREVDA